MRLADIELTCTVAFQKWRSEELVDPRLYDILEEAFIAGFLARDGVEPAPVPQERAA